MKLSLMQGKRLMWGRARGGQGVADDKVSSHILTRTLSPLGTDYLETQLSTSKGSRPLVLTDVQVVDHEGGRAH